MTAPFLEVGSPGGPPHGSKATYDRHKCRCDRCRLANTWYMKHYREQKSLRENI